MKYLFGLVFIAILLACNEKEIEPLSNDFRDVSSQLSVQDFENIKMMILDDGIYEPFFNMYQSQPIYSFDDFTATLLPEVGQLNITCDPEISDFNQLVIYDSELNSKYIFFQIVRQGDLEKEDIKIPDYDGLKENKVYLLKYNEYDLDDMLNKSAYYITKMKSRVK